METLIKASFIMPHISMDFIIAPQSVSMGYETDKPPHPRLHAKHLTGAPVDKHKRAKVKILLSSAIFFTLISQTN